MNDSLSRQPLAAHTSAGTPFLHAAGHDSRLFARFTRVLTGHAPIGAFRSRFHLDGPVDCLCGQPVETVEHILGDCPVWVRKWAPRSRLLDSIVRLDPFADVLWFLKHNPLAATFEFVDYQAQALAELERGAPDGPFCQQIIQLWRRARIGNAAPLKDKEAVLDAFDAEDVD